MNRKRLAAVPALILLSDCSEIAAINYIRTDEYMIGRSTEADLIIRQPSVSRKHCTFKHDDESNKWSIIAQSRQPITVRGKEIKSTELFVLECGDKIKISPSLVFEFKCSPNEDLKCCTDFKKMKLSAPLDVSTAENNMECVSLNDTPELPATVPELPATVPISQLPDSSDVIDNFRPLEVLNDTDPTISNFKATEPLNDTDSDFSYLRDTEVRHKVDSEVSFSYEVKSLNLSITEPDNSSPVNINELENAIRRYLDSLILDISSQCDDDDVSWKQKLKDELTFRLEYLRKLDDFSSTCESHLSTTNDADVGVILEALKNSSSFFKECYSKLKYRSEQLECGEQNENLNRIIVNLDALLISKTTSIMHFLHKFFDTSLKSTLLNSGDGKSAGDSHTNDKPQINFSEEEREKFVEEKKNLQTEIEKYKESINWKDARIKFLEMKVKDKEKLEIELESAKEENELMETKVAELKRTLANMEMMELEYKCLLESTKHRDADKRSKDDLEQKINILNNQVKDLKEENSQLLADKFTSQDEIAKLKEKCDELEEKLKEKIVTTSRIPSTCTVSGDQPSQEFCCDMVKEIKGSLMDLMEREFQCSICGEMFIDSTVTNCNHVFCSFCLQEWKKNHKTCPFCRAGLKQEVRATIVDEYITGILKLLSDKMYTERLELISERKTKKAPAKQPRAKAARRGRQSAGLGVIDLSGL